MRDVLNTTKDSSLPFIAEITYSFMTDEVIYSLLRGSNSLCPEPCNAFQTVSSILINLSSTLVWWLVLNAWTQVWNFAFISRSSLLANLLQALRRNGAFPKVGLVLMGVWSPTSVISPSVHMRVANKINLFLDACRKLWKVLYYL